METPLFSILIPAYNAEATLQETLESVERQSFDRWECLIVNDGSTDATQMLAQSFATTDSRFRVLNQENAGIAAAYNAGIAHAHGEWIVMLSADDLLEPDHLATIASAIGQDAGLALITTNGSYLLDDDSKQPVYRGDPWFKDTACSLSALFDRCLYATGAVMRRDAVLAVGGFCEGLYAEDYYLFLKMLACGYRHLYLADPLSQHRRNDTQRSAHGLAMRKADLESIERIAQEYELTGEQQRAFEAARDKLRRNIRFREVLYRLVGARIAERLIGALRRG